MADPFNYQMQVKSPFEAAVQGYALGEQINAATAQREANLAQQQVRQLQAMETAQKIIAMLHNDEADGKRSR